jgi:soluble lytic murein transglycosylase
MRTRYPEAARVLQAASRMASATAEQDAFHAARAIARSNENVRAAKAMRAFTKRFPKSKHVSEALYLAAWLELRVDHPGAEKVLATWLESAHAKAEPGLAAEAQVELGMRALRAKKHAVAAQRFAAYAAGQSGCLERGRGLYWGGRAELGQNKRAEAVALWNEAAQIEPLCWYALLARDALSGLGETLPPPYPSITPAVGLPPSSNVSDAAVASDASVDGSIIGGTYAVPPPAGQSPSGPTPSRGSLRSPAEESVGAATIAAGVSVAVALPREAAFYAAIGFDGDAVTALRGEEAAVRASAPAGHELQALVAAYVALGEHARPRALVHQAPQGLLTRAPTPQTAFALRAAYARPHRELVQSLAASEQVDEDFIYAIMLKESAFDPRVMSNADAIGLMQLLPGTGKMVGKELGLTVTRETLLDPQDNIRLGVRLLKQLMKRYDGQMALAAAAYNAGAHRVDEWLARAARAPAKDNALALDRFVEDIPIDQTRNYVRRVTAFYARYRYLGADGTGTGPVLQLPAAVSP